MDGMIASGTINIVRRVRVSREKLRMIAEILEIPENERGLLVSGVVYLESGPGPAQRKAGRSSRASGTGGSSPSRRK